MRSTVKQTASLVIVLGALAAPQAAQAGEKEEARKHYDRALELADDGQPEGAIVEFRRSYDLTHHFAVLYNIGQVYVSLARPVEAVDAYERYLADGGKKIQQPGVPRWSKRSHARKPASRPWRSADCLRERLFAWTARRIAKSPIAAPVRVGVGTHAIAASADGYDPAETEVIVAGEDRRVVELALAKHVVETPPRLR